MKTLTIVTGYNAPGKSDATGAFLPEARAFQALHGYRDVVDGAEHIGGAWLEYAAPMPAANRRSMAEKSIAATPGLEVLAVFGHGTASSLIATGHTLRHVHDLAAAIATAARGAASTQPLTVVLYACSTGYGKIGFADQLADALAARVASANVWAHSTPGHTSWNPYVELAGGPNGGDPIARPGDPLWKRWRERLRDDQAFRLSFWQAAHGLERAAALEAVRAAI